MYTDIRYIIYIYAHIYTDIGYSSRTRKVIFRGYVSAPMLKMVTHIIAIDYANKMHEHPLFFIRILEHYSVVDSFTTGCGGR